MHSVRTLFLFASSMLAITAAGCGTRTPLEIRSDGSVSPRDGGVRDAGRDGGTVRCTSDRMCDDGDICNGLEFCTGAGVCDSFPPIDCSDGIPCTEDVCLPGMGCQNRPNDRLCGPGERCDPGSGCTGRPCMIDPDCDDGRACNGFEFCLGGMCLRSDPPFCDDGVDCTIDTCVEPSGFCDSRPDDGRCMRGTCDPRFGCTGMTCTGPFDCDDGAFCNGSEICGPDGACTPGMPPSCADGVACTDDFCSDAIGGCGSTPNSSLCPAGQLCRAGVGCVTVGCMSDFDCNDGSICNGMERCITVSAGRRCVGGVPLSCEDMLECTIDRCIDAVGGCLNEPRSFREVCGNGIDDDCDFVVDCDDSDCAGTPGCPSCVPTEPIEFSCFDGRDNDCDGPRDCSDPDCTSACMPTEFDCFNFVDDDFDGLVDCDDPDCRAMPGICPSCVPTEMSERTCNDGRDNDCDRAFDCSDFDCRSSASCRVDAGPPRDGGGVCTMNELGVAQCTDSVDNDCDGRTDCLDPDCRPLGPMSECCNGIDDDADGTTNLFTCRCFDNSTCLGVGDFEQVCWTESFSVCAPRCNFVGGDAFCRMFTPMAPRCNRMTGECVL